MIPFAGPLQNGTDYEIWITKDDGTRLYGIQYTYTPAPPPYARRSQPNWVNITSGRQALVEGAVEFLFTRVLNNEGYFTLTLPGSTDRDLLRYDNRVLFWRKPVGGQMSIAFEGLIRHRRTPTDRDGTLTRTITGPDLNYFLSGRVVAYTAGTAQAQQTDQADDMLVEIAKDNLGTDAAAARALNTTFFSVAASTAGGPSIVKGFSYRNVLDVMREIADAARTAGTEVYFQITPTTETAFKFRTYIDQLGRDRTTDSTTSRPLIFGLEYGNMAMPVLDEDARDEINFAYALGQGEGALRSIQTSEDTTRTGRSIFGRREGKIDARAQTTDAAVVDAADGLLVKGRPVTTFAADLLNVPGSIFGKDWDFGDRITATYDGRQFDALVRAVTVRVGANGAESIDAVLEAYL